MRGVYVYYAQRKDKPADPMMGQAFTRKYDLASWVKGREDAFIYYRYCAYGGGTCKVITL